jgi:hypothetical protein
MFEMTYNEAARIQRAQMVWYRQAIGRKGVQAIKRATTCPPDLNPDEPISIFRINELVPRGGSFESLLTNRHPAADPTTMAWHDAITRGLVYSL